MQVIPPGMDFSSVSIQEDTADADGDLKDLIGADGASPRAVPPIWSEASTLSLYKSVSLLEDTE